MRCYWAGAGTEGGRFEGADNGGSDGDDAAVLAAGADEGIGGFGGNGVAFAVEMDIGDALDAQRGEGAESDMEGDASDLDTELPDVFEHLRGEVETGGGCGD